MRGIWAVVVAGALAGCVAPMMPAPDGPLTLQAAPPAPADFAAVVARIEPMAEAMCRRQRLPAPCDFRIVIDDRPGQPPNAFQTLDRTGRPILGFTLALIATARNADELAFVVGHEAAHHILGHLPQRAQQAMSGALLGAILAASAGADQAGIDEAQQMGAMLAAQKFSKPFELEADALGTEIALRAGFDPIRGAEFFDRLPDPGDRFLGTHPANAQRKALVRAAVARLTAGG